MMKRTKLCDRALPVYSVGEEITNTATHLIGGVLGVPARRKTHQHRVPK